MRSSTSTAVTASPRTGEGSITWPRSVPRGSSRRRGHDPARPALRVAVGAGSVRHGPNDAAAKPHRYPARRAEARSIQAGADAPPHPSELPERHAARRRVGLRLQSCRHRRAVRPRSHRCFHERSAIVDADCARSQVAAMISATTSARP